MLNSEVPWQSSLNENIHTAWDVLIVGAGPAGATAAMILARNGHRVLLLDQHRFPRDKACGDILIADTLRVLGRLGLTARVEQLAHSLHTAAIFSPSRIEVRIPGRYLTLRRLYLDELLARAAVEAGAVLCQAHAARISEGGELICECSGGANIRARIGIVATGADIRLLNAGSRRPPANSPSVAMRQYVRSAMSLDHLVFAYDRSTLPGYAWIAPLGDGLYNVGCGVARSGQSDVNLRRMLGNFLIGFPLARELMKTGEALTPLRGALLRCGLDEVSPEGVANVLAVGETIGTTYPFTGEGIGKAMETAELAAETVHAALASGDLGALRGFSSRLETGLRPRYAGYDAAQRWLSRPWLNDLVMRRVRRSKFLQTAFAGIVDETVDPQTIFSVRGLFHSLWH